MMQRQLIAVIPDGVGRHHADTDFGLLVTSVALPPSPPLTPIDATRPVREIRFSMIAAAPNLTSPTYGNPTDA